MKNKLLIILIAAFLNAVLLEGYNSLMANNSLYIYGTITTVDDETYTGQIRWGKEEAFWFDFFNSSKRENENLKLLSSEELDYLDEKDHSDWGTKWNNKWNWGWNNSNHSHSFSCEFGNIKSIRLTRGEKVVLEFKNGEAMTLEGGSNDIGTKIQVVDSELGLVKLEWDRVDRVEFSNTPANLESFWGKPLYGTVNTVDGSFTGYLQWDHDERMGQDELNGEYRDGSLDIAFDKIKSIEKTYRGSNVVLHSGREFELTGSNDVDDDNRGIIVNIPGYGRVDIQWDEFESLSFSEVPNNISVSYGDYNGQNKIRGTVKTTKGESLQGTIIFDLDESLQLEMLNGIEKHLEYFFPFSCIKNIQPKNRKTTLVELKNGSQFHLEDKVDVNENNDGILVFINRDEYTYVPWEEIESLDF